MFSAAGPNAREAERVADDALNQVVTLNLFQGL